MRFIVGAECEPIVKRATLPMHRAGFKAH